MTVGFNGFNTYTLLGAHDFHVLVGGSQHPTKTHNPLPLTNLELG